MSGFLSSLGSSTFQLAFQCSPILFVNGIAGAIPGGALPIISITQSVDFLAGILGGGSTPGLDEFFASFTTLPNATLVDWTMGTYPFANMGVAANALIANPLRLSLRMRCPARQSGYAGKLAVMTALTAVLNQHNGLGGSYTVLTPAQIYPNMILLVVRDISSGETKQPQTDYQWDFAGPLLTLNQAQNAQNSFMSQVTGGTSGPTAWTGTGSLLGNPNAGVTGSLIPAASGIPTTSPFLPPGATT